mgnify:CR=1 FL=1
MRTNKIKYRLTLITLALILAIFNFAIMISCSKHDDRAYVFSIEVLFNNENHKDFNANINEKVDIGITVNNYRDSYEFEYFYAWIDYNDDKIELNYGINEISFNVGGNYQVKVTIIDGYNRLMTKRMPFTIIDRPPEILGEINGYLGENADKNLYAFPNIGCILPNFEITDDSGEIIIPNITAQLGQVTFYSDSENNTSFYYYIYKNGDNNFKEDIITIKAKDFGGNEKEINFNLYCIKYSEKCNNWLIRNEYNGKDFIALDENMMYFDGNTIDDEITEASFVSYISNKINSIILNFKRFDKDSFFCLNFEGDDFHKYKIEFRFDQKIFIEDTEFNESKLSISFDKANNTISVSDSKATYSLFIKNNNLTAAEFEMSKIDFNVKID